MSAYPTLYVRSRECANSTQTRPGLGEEDLIRYLRTILYYFVTTNAEWRYIDTDNAWLSETDSSTENGPPSLRRRDHSGGKACHVHRDVRMFLRSVPSIDEKGVEKVTCP